MKQKLDSLFWRFAEEKFVYGGVYPYYTELVFAFADYVENAGDDELRRLLPGCRPSLLAQNRSPQEPTNGSAAMPKP